MDTVIAMQHNQADMSGGSFDKAGTPVKGIFLRLCVDFSGTIFTF